MEPVKPTTPGAKRAWPFARKTPPWLCAAINQLAFPGLGTILHGRRVGYFQAVLMVAGFVLTMGYLLVYLAAVVRYLQHSGWSEAEFHAQYEPYQWSLVAGLPLCGIAWIWAGISSLAMLKDARGEKPPPSRSVS